MDTIPASERARERLKALMEGHGEEADLCSERWRLRCMRVGLSTRHIEALFADGIAERLHLGQPARRCWPPGVCWRTATRYFSTWYQ
jgi:hypothetical protein